MRQRLLMLLLLGGLIPAHAVVVRGRVTDTLGQALPGARVQLILLSGGPKNAANTIAGPDGAFELLSGYGGRFLLLTSPPVNIARYAPQIGESFYGGRSDVLTVDVALNVGEITPQWSALGGFPLPLKQQVEEPKQVAADTLLTQAAVVPELRPLAGVRVVEQGQIGTPVTLFVRGAPVGKMLVDGVSAERVGGGFDVGLLSSAGLSAQASRPAMEIVGGAIPLYGLDAWAGVFAVTTPVAAGGHPVLTITADAGNLSTVRSDGALSIVDSRSDALLEFARFNTDNDLPAARIHQVTAAGNLGYQISGNTSVRLTLRNDVDASPMASPYGFYGVAPRSKLANQNLVGGFTFDTRTPKGWHNAVRYGLVRERAEAFHFSTPATGVPVTITGANRYTATGTATFLAAPAREDEVTNRDEYGWQTDYRWKRWLNVVGTARYDVERGADLIAGSSTRLSRNHLWFAMALSGEMKRRLFYDASGFLDRAADIGLHGGPRLGLRYVPVRPGPRRFRGTSLHLTAATGARELSTVETAQLGTLVSPRSRTLALGVEQNILAKVLSLRATYFYGQYSHETEALGLGPLRLGNALAYRAQGIESEVRWQPSARMLIASGYTFLASVVERSGAVAGVNPDLPGMAIGATTALVGQRPFDRAPHVGFLVAQYTGSTFSASVKATLSGRSDGTTGLVLDPTLLLPNHDLSPGYGSVDAALSYNVSHAVTVFAQFTNVLDDRNVAPLGYLSTPFGVRVGVRVRLGGE